MKLAKGLSLSDKVRAMKNWLSRVIRGEVGQALPIVLAMLAVGSLLIVPLLNFVSTSLNAGETVERKIEGLYAADAGVEDALWRLKYNKPASFPYSYELADVNGMSVSVVIGEVTSLSGVELEDSGEHVDWLEVTKSVSYNDGLGIYFYTLYVTNKCSANVKIERIMIVLPRDVEYVDSSTGGDFTTDDPAVSGNPTTGITLDWEFSPPYPNIGPGPDPNNGEYNTVAHTFQLNGPPGVAGVGSHCVVQARRQDVGGTVWDVDTSLPYQITAQAKEAGDTVVATIRAGVWSHTELSISCWQINP